jgi:hypothetical protein
MASKADVEMRWVDAWNQLHAIVGSRHDVRCLLPDGSTVDLEACRAWLQESVYDGYRVDVQTGWVGHHAGVVVSRSRTDEPFNGR